MSANLALAKKLVEDARSILLDNQDHHSAALGLTAALAAISMHEGSAPETKSPFTQNDKYRYAILDVSSRIHGSATGTGEDLSDDQLKEFVEWLDWRIQTWTASTSNDDYEAAVWNVAYAAVAEGREDLLKRQNTDAWLSQPLAAR